MIKAIVKYIEKMDEEVSESLLKHQLDKTVFIKELEEKKTKVFSIN